MLLFIVNEKSGNGRAKTAWQTVERSLKNRGAAYGKICAESAGQAIQKAEHVLKNNQIDALVAVGGDGTVHSLLEAAWKHRVPLGFIPCGSGNDTALAFGMPKDPLAALEIVLGGHVREADLLLTTRPDGKRDCSLISIAAGLDGAVAEDVNNSRYKKWCNRLRLGRVAYIIGLLRMLARYQPQTIHVAVDGIARSFPKGWLVAVANTPSYGGGLRICPEALPDDGLLDVCIVNRCSALQLLAVFPTVLTGRHVRSRFVTVLRGKEIRIDSASPLPAYGDGEPAGSTPIRASVLPRQLLVLASSG